MNCKTFLITGLSFFLFLVTVIPSQAFTNNTDPIVEIESLETKADFEQAHKVLKDRVEQLKIDKKTAVTKTEKEAVKKQIRDTKDEIQAVKAKALSGGIYIGSGALILIIVLLILL